MPPHAIAPPEPLEHSVSALCYRLIEGRVSLAPLRILARREIGWALCRVTFYILGTSHAVVIENGDQSVTELLTCCPPFDECSVIREARLHQRSIVPAIISGFACRSEMESFELYSGWRAPDRFRSDCSLQVSFPRSGKIAPETAICWSVSATRLIVETLHTYPEESQGVHSKSEFEVINATS